MVFYQDFPSFLLDRNYKILRDCEELEIARQSCRGYCQEQGGKLLRLFLLDFVQELGLRKKFSFTLHRTQIVHFLLSS
jgi:hypothetical protein